MSKEENKNKLQIGRFTNGTCVVFGFKKSNILRGIIIRVYYPYYFKLFSYLRFEEYDITREIPSQFKKIKIFNRNTTYQTFDFLHELSDLPTAIFRYQGFLKSQRNVLIEKCSSKNILYNYINSSSAEQDLLIIKMLIRKYGKRIARNVYTGEKKITSDRFLDRGCNVNIPSHYNEKLFVELSDWASFEGVYQIIIDRLVRFKNYKEDLENIVDKNK